MRRSVRSLPSQKTGNNWLWLQFKWNERLRCVLSGTGTFILTPPCLSDNITIVLSTKLTKPFKSEEWWIILYNAFMRSVLEYCSSVWFPLCSNRIYHIEPIQRRFLRMLCSKLGLRRKLSGYKNRHDELNLETLARRRTTFDLCTLHKIVICRIGDMLLDKICIRVSTCSVCRPQIFVTQALKKLCFCK